MIEQRRNKRFPVTMHLEVSSLFKQDNVKVNNINAPIDVKDVSKSGIGFVSTAELPVGFYFNSRLVFHDMDKNSGNEADGSEKRCLNCVVRILRQVDMGDGKFSYGCEFVGMASVFDYIFEELEKEVNKA